MKTRKRMIDAAEEFIAYRTRLGYRDHSVAHYTRSLARFADVYAAGAPLTGDIIQAWAAQRPGASLHRIGRTRRFSEWLLRTDPRTKVPASLLIHIPLATRKPPYIYAPEEIDALLLAARKPNLRACVSLGRSCVAMLGLLAATGMRSGEVVRLADGDVDLHEGVLHVRDSKNLSLRLVALHPTAVSALQRYRVLRRREHPHSAASAFFLTPKGKPFYHDTFMHYFETIRRRADVPFRPHWRTPRLTDFRHTFAVRHLQARHEAGGDVHRAVADLAVYMGHALVDYTYWYLTGTPELLAVVGERFERHVRRVRREGGQ